MTLTAPDHLRGRMTRHNPPHIRDERAAWIKARCDEGHRQGDIAAALGIHDSTVSSILHNRGLSKPRAPLCAKGVKQLGVRLGRLTDLYDGLPGEIREKLADEAAQQRVSIADAIAARLAPQKNRSGAPNG
ncbi:helix-turn-helix transcriptional regulator [Paracoccus sp. PS-1]|uniref:helix-turn-helix domain-containing protein n=1 Tax=Paracoccus sp. PS1 TaxID=2963938 RepID=UPI0027E4E011|nr:helix-turn-helix transcriptional regulator [Paracoccus sp. PS1]MDQ7262245.1 helix-turn-helix transcriptional regulator [Paracoccus sp. PS1]